ncbi:TetR/AcrR family transcriptional regulator [soil metagenome]
MTSSRANGRPRGDDADARIMDAAIREYAERGRAGFSINGVARRAGVGKSSVYLRWPDKDTLLADAVDARSGSPEDVDTGTLRGDLAALSTNLLRFWLDPIGWATLRVAVDSVGIDLPPTYHATITDRHRDAAALIVQRAVARGEVGPDVPGGLLIEAVYGTLIMKTLGRAGELRELSDDDLHDVLAPLVDFVLAAVASYDTV